MITNPQVDEDELTVVPLTEVPKFESQIPPDLVEKLSPRDRHTLQTLSIIAQRQDWLITVLLNHNAVMRKQDRRQVKTQKRLEWLIGKWSPVFYMGGIALTVFINKTVTRIWP